MRFLSVILLACIIFMSSLKGILPAAQPKVMDCCKEMTGKACSQHHHDAAKDNHSNGCNQTGCDMLFSCSICGFIVKESLTIPTVKAFQLPKPVAHYIPGDLTSYNADNWRPPRAC